MSTNVVDLAARRRAPRRTPRQRAGAFVRRALGRLVSWTFTALLLTALVAFLGLAVGPHLFGYRTVTMLTGSMAPEINPGDVIVTKPKPADQVEVGDVLTFRAPVEGKPVETHRVVKVGRTAQGELVIRTKGDANAAPDPWRARIEGETVWETVRVIPSAGKVLRVLRAPALQQGLFWSALASLVLIGLARIWKRREPDPAPTPLRAAALDGAALGRLGSDVDDPEFAAAFASRYQELLPRRLVRLTSALASNDLDSALDASLSLKVSSSTVGARELHELASVIELNVRRRDVAVARAMTPDLTDAVRRADRALAAYLASNRGA
ncbi:signal peptidase I [Nocardioides pantholopis]|uniref:signal peptidase I n=1 Tax=Nocardioides pantholopis TaxID=2483798 RepID=UPI0013DE4E86|nr:signal peptidase I [Nocardioides pantholopis]